MRLLFHLYRAMLRSSIVDTLDCIFWGLLDMVMRVVYWIVGLDRAPAFFTGWQQEHFCFYPPVKYPLPDRSLEKPRFTWLDARGVYTGAVIFRHIPLETVEQLVSPGLILQPELITPDRTYPVVYLFGYQQDLRQSWMPIRGVNYLEFAVGVLGADMANPSKDGYTGPFLYMPRLFLNRLYPTILGLLCCYPKRWERIATTEDTYTVKSLLGGKPILEGRFKPSGAIGKPADFTCFPRWRMLLSKSGINRFSGSHFIYLDYDWGWNYSLMQPLTGTVEVFEDGIPGLPRGKYTFDPLTTDVIGAFRIAIPFEWVPPFRRAELDPMEPLKPACPAPPPPVEPPSSESSAGTSRK
jgi:hypothetical protein